MRPIRLRAACVSPERLRGDARATSDELVAFAVRHPEFTVDRTPPPELDPMPKQSVKKNPPAVPKPTASQVKRATDDVLARLDGGAPDGAQAALFGEKGKIKAVVKAIVPGLLEGAAFAADGTLSPSEMLKLVAIAQEAVKAVLAIRSGDSAGPAPAA